MTEWTSLPLFFLFGEACVVSGCDKGGWSNGTQKLPTGIQGVRRQLSAIHLSPLAFGIRIAGCSSWMHARGVERGGKRRSKVTDGSLRGVSANLGHPFAPPIGDDNNLTNQVTRLAMQALEG